MMTISLLAFGTCLAAAVGLYDAYAKGRDAMGWIVSIAASILGGVPAGLFVPMGLIGVLNPGKDAALLVGLAGLVIGVLVGSSIVLWIVNRFR